jgi:adenylylsulfate kinase
MSTYVLMAGLPGTGKSTLAKALAMDLDAVVLNKDLLRAALFPGRLTDYSRPQDDLCFKMLLEAAGYLAAHKRARFIFLDGRTFSRSEQIEQAVRAAESAGSEWRILLATCPDEIAEARLVQDAAVHPAANRNAAMYREVKNRFEAIAYPHLRIDTSQPLEWSVKRCLEFLGPAGESGLDASRQPTR